MGDKMISLQGSTTIAASATDLTWRGGTDGATHTNIRVEQHGLQSVRLELGVATANLTALRILAKTAKDSSAWVVLASSAADYAGGSPFVARSQVFDASNALVDTDFSTIDATQWGVLDLALPPCWELKIEATGNTAVVTGYLQASTGASGGSMVGGGVGDATAALQTAGNTLLGTIDGDTGSIKTNTDKIPAKGTAVMTGSTPVTLASDDTQMAALIADTAAIETATKNRDDVVSATKRLTISAASQDLPTLYGSALPAGLTAIGLVPEDSTDDIRWNYGTATASTSHVAATGEIMPTTKTLADTLEMIDGAGAGSKYVRLTLYTPRN